MGSDKLKKLIEHRDAILLAEIGALIHDLGKLSEEFVKSKCVEESGNWVHHTAIIEYDVYRNIPHARKVKQILESIEIKLDKNNIIKLYDFVLGHHKKQWDKKENWDKPENFTFKYPKYDKDNIFLKFIIASDTFDSEEDKSYSKDSQSICGVYKSTSFGLEKELIKIDELIEERKKIYKILIDWLDTCDFNKIVRKRREYIDKIRKSFSKALGETRRSANDVTLWDHSYMTATIMKALVAYRVLNPSFIVSSKREIIEKKPFKIFAVGWDFFDFINQSYKIPDVVGRIKILEKIKEEIKRIVEEECALGNSIYEDDFGVYFLIPSIINDEDLKDVKEKIFDVFNKEVNGILLPIFHIEPKSDKKSKLDEDKEFRIGKLLTRAMKSIKEKILQHEVDLIKTPVWVESWRNSVQLPKDKLICNVCGKGYFCRGDDKRICNICEKLRKLGRRSEPPQTVFIDEISWNPKTKRYENVCLLVAKFDLDEWLSGKFVQSLFIRNPNEQIREQIEKLWNFYHSKFYNKNQKALDENFLRKFYNFKILNAVLCKIPIGKLHESAVAKAKQEVKEWYKQYEYTLNEFEKDIINQHKLIIDQIFRKLSIEILKDKEERENLKQMFEENLKFEKVKEYFEHYLNRLEEFLKDFENKDQVKLIIIDSTSYIDVFSKIFRKPPSPSRLMRVWNNTKEFIENISELICLKVPIISECKIILKDSIDNLTPNIAYFLEIENHGIMGEVISLEKTSRELYVITPHTNDFLVKNRSSLKDAKILLRHPDNKDEIVGMGVIEGIKENCRVVRAYRIISTSPTLFMAIIPASVSLDIVKMIKEEYMKHFGKVFGKLPLHIGLIYFKRKMPIFVVLDSANRMINEFEGLNDGEEVYVIRNLRTENNNYIILELNPTKEEQKSFKYEVKIPYTLGDGNIDYYHPYLRVEDSSDDIIEIKIDDKTVVQKHISKIKKDDRITVKKYYLDFEFLDSNIRRFDIGEKRKHWLFTDSTNKPKPYLLWDIDYFERLRKLIQKLGLTTTQIMNLYEMLMAKLEEWEIRKLPAEFLSSGNKEDEEKAKVFEKLVENAIKSIPLRLEVVDGESSKGKISKEDFKFLKDSIISGLFFDFVDLWHTILKKKFEEGEENV